MPQVPAPILELARTHHEQLRALERDARVRVRRELDRALRRIELDREFRQLSDFEALQAAEIELLAKLTARETGEGLEQALEEILAEGLLLAPNHAERELLAWTAFHGGEARPLNLAALAEISRESLIERIPQSLATWGTDVARRIRKELSASRARREFADNTIDAIQRVTGAERWKADRIFRTELFEGYNAAHLESLRTARDVYEIPAKKSAIATFDGRTDPDSYPVHGQVRELDENFVDGDGRSFLHPPGRPNDREKEIPWLNEGDDIPLISTEEGIARAEAERARLRELAGRLPVPARPGEALQPPTTPLGRRQRLIQSWVNGSNSNRAVAMKQAALLEFELEGQLWNPRGRNLPDEEALNLIRDDLRSMYRDTQADFAGRRVHQLRLYRGVKTDVTVEGTIEAWTSDPDIARRFAGPRGHVLVADIDRRRILSSVESPGWVNGRFGDQREYLVLSDPPPLAFDLGDWKSGPFRAGDLDVKAVSAGPWGVLEDSAGRARLEHIPSGRTLLEGVEYSRDGMVEAAKYLDRSGYFDAVGNLTELGAAELADAIDVLRVRYGANTLAAEAGAEGIEILGERLGRVNRDLSRGSATTWSRRANIEVVREGVDGYRIDTLPGVVQRDFGVITDPAGPGDGYFTIVHLPTGKEIFEGTRTFYSAGIRVPVDLGGWQQRHVRAVAERLHEYVDEATGAILPGRVDEFERIVAELRTRIAINTFEDPVELANGIIRDALDLEDPESAADFVDFLVERNTVRSGPAKTSAAAVRATHVPSTPKPQLSPEERFEEAVEARRSSLRRGAYSRYSDFEFDRAVQAEARRRNDEAARIRVERQTERYNAFPRIELESSQAEVVRKIDEMKARRYGPKVPGDATPDEAKAEHAAAQAAVEAEAERKRREREENE